MGHLLTILQKNKIIVQDGFNRADSATTLGNANTGPAWQASTGTWGIISNRLYSASDANAEIVSIEIGRGDFVLMCTTNGQTSGGVNLRLFNVLFRMLDAQNYLQTRIVGGGIEVYKSVAGVSTLIASTTFPEAVDNADYEFKIICSGNSIFIHVGGVLKISYTLSGGDTVFAGYTKAGFRLTKVGAPTGTARADRFLVEAV